MTFRLRSGRDWGIQRFVVKSRKLEFLRNCTQLGERHFVCRCVSQSSLSSLSPPSDDRPVLRAIVLGGAIFLWGGAEVVLGGAIVLLGGAKVVLGRTIIVLGGTIFVPGGAEVVLGGAIFVLGGAKVSLGGAIVVLSRAESVLGGAIAVLGGVAVAVNPCWPFLPVMAELWLARMAALPVCAAAFMKTTSCLQSSGGAGQIRDGAM